MPAAAAISRVVVAANPCFQNKAAAVSRTRSEEEVGGADSARAGEFIRTGAGAARYVCIVARTRDEVTFLLQVFPIRTEQG